MTAQSIIVENRTGSVSVKLLTKVFRELEEQKVIKRHKYHNSINEGYIIVIDVKKLINLCCQ